MAIFQIHAYTNNNIEYLLTAMNGQFEFKNKQSNIEAENHDCIEYAVERFCNYCTQSEANKFSEFREVTFKILEFETVKFRVAKSEDEYKIVKEKDVSNTL